MTHRKYCLTFSLTLYLLALSFCVVALVQNKWYHKRDITIELDNGEILNGTFYMGVWKECRTFTTDDAMHVEECKSWDDVTLHDGRHLDYTWVYLNAWAVIVASACIGMYLCHIIVYLNGHTMPAKLKKSVLLDCLCLLTAIITYAVHYDDNLPEEYKGGDFDYCYILLIVADILVFFAALAMSVGAIESEYNALIQQA